jgi:hypothetical protein
MGGEVQMLTCQVYLGNGGGVVRHSLLLVLEVLVPTQRLTTHTLSTNLPTVLLCRRRASNGASSSRSQS